MRKIFFDLNPDCYEKRFGVHRFKLEPTGSSKQQVNIAKVINRLKILQANAICLGDGFPDHRINEEDYVSSYANSLFSLCDVLHELSDAVGVKLNRIIIEAPSPLASMLIGDICKIEGYGVVVAEKLNLSEGWDLSDLKERLDSMESFIENHIFISDLPCEKIEEVLDVMEDYTYDVFFQDQKLI